MEAQKEKFYKIIEENERFLIGCHVHPDGDAIGSMLALGTALSKYGKKVELVCTEELPSVYRFLAGSSKIKMEVDNGFIPEVLICVDCAERDRTALPENIWENTNMIVINLDHHITNTKFGNINIVVPDAAATGELIYRVLKSGNFSIDNEIATALYTAIATDTGFFRFDNTSAFTLETVSWLVRNYNVKPSKVAEHVNEQKSFNSIRLLGEVLSRIQLGMNGKVAWIVLTQEMLNKYLVENEETESYVNYARAIEGVEIGIIFKELRPNEFKVSWRSTEAVDVSKLASYFGGGGHARAAGCSLNGSEEEVIKLLLDFVADFYRG